MKSIALLGSIVAVCSIGCVLAPASVVAKSAGGGAAAGARGGFGAGAGFHHGLRRHGLTFHRPGFAKFAARGHFAGNNLWRQRSSVLPYNSWSNYGWPDDAGFDPYYYYLPPAALAQASPASEPVAPSQQPPTRVLVVQPGCRTQDQKVPSEAGGERVVRITRCY